MSLRTRLNFLVGVSLLASASSSVAEFDIESTASSLFTAFNKIQQQQEPMPVEPGRELDVQNYLIALMRPLWGMDVGYFGDGDSEFDMPPTGVLLENMFTGTRAIVTRDFGINMHAAGELMFRVGSELINDAATREEAIASLDSVIPAVRMTDRLLPDAVRNDAAQNLAANLQIRMFVLGGEVELTKDFDWIELLANVKIELRDQDKSTLAASGSDDLRLHPIDSVLRLCDALNARGIRLRQGDVIGTGTWTDSHPVEPLTRLSAVFEGLEPGHQSQVYMGFR